MRRATVLVAAAATTAVMGGFLVGWLFSSKEPAATAPEVKVAERELVPGTIPSRAAGMAPMTQPQTPPAAQPAMTPAMAPGGLPPRSQTTAEPPAAKST